MHKVSIQREKNEKFRRLFAIVMISALNLISALAGFGQTGQESEKASLYQRLGGYDGISKFVDTAFPRVAGHSTLQRFFQGHSHDSKYRQRQLIIEFLCRETGGSCVYMGRPMNAVHVGLQITEEDWNIFVSIISSTLSELKVGNTEKTELLSLFEKRFKPDIVEQP